MHPEQDTEHLRTSLQPYRSAHMRRGRNWLDALGKDLDTLFYMDLIPPGKAGLLKEGLAWQ